jgi:hypothetical protein
MGRAHRPSVDGAALSAGMAAVSGAVIFGVAAASVAGFGIMFGISLVGSLALAGISMALAPNKPSQQIPFAGDAQARTQMIRSSIANRRVVVGRVVCSGPLVFAAVHPKDPGGTPDNANLSLVIVLAAHKVKHIGQIFFNDTPVDDPRFASNQTTRRYLGTADQAADQRLIDMGVGWTAAHRLRGLAYIVVELFWDQEVYATGIPNIKAEVWGLECYDPRDGSTAFTNNVALITRAYLRDQDWGLHAQQNEIDDLGAFNPSADICDQYVDLVGEARPFSVLDTLPTFLLYLHNPRFAFGIGDRVRLVPGAGATLPAPLLANTDYYVIPTETRSSSAAIPEEARSASGDVTWGNGIMLAPTLWHARNRFALQLTTAGSAAGASLIVRIAQPRYTANGVLDTGKTPKTIIDQLMSADVGVCVWQGGFYRHFAGAPRASSFVLTASDLRGPLAVVPTIDKQNLSNQIFGNFIDPANGWQPSDFDGVANAQYVAEDLGENIRRDIELAYTTDAIMARRIAKVHSPCRKTALLPICIS